MSYRIGDRVTFGIGLRSQWAEGTERHLVGNVVAVFPRGMGGDRLMIDVMGATYNMNDADVELVTA
jgi:hypothetical protein